MSFWLSKPPLPTKVYLRLLEAGPNLVGYGSRIIVLVLWCAQVCILLPLSLRFTALLKQAPEI